MLELAERLSLALSAAWGQVPLEAGAWGGWARKPMSRSGALGGLLLVLVACGPKDRDPAHSPGPSAGARSGSHSKRTSGKKAVEVARPGGSLGRKDAERYVLELINRDRAVQGLEPVEWDTIAARAGQEHADDMASNGYTAHWGTEGSNPEQRYTEAGGMDMVQENAGCFADGKPRELDSEPRFDPAAIEKVENAFMNEHPPADGHRKNILKRWHTHVGVGLAKAKGIDVVCLAQEFVDRYGSYDAVPRKAKVGQKVRVQGKVESPAKFVGVGVARTALGSPHNASELLRTSTYPIPAPYQTYFPKGFVTPIPVEVHGNSFVIDFPLNDGGRPGLYELSVWAEVPGTKDFVMVSLRTVRVEK